MRLFIWIIAFAVVISQPFASAAEKAVLAASKGDIVRNGLPKPGPVPEGTVWFLYPVTLKEMSGQTGITLTGYKKCYEGGEPFRRYCSELLRNIVDIYGTDRLPPGGTLSTRRPAWVWSDPTGKKITVTVTYYGKDDNGQAVEAGYNFSFIAK